MDSPKVRPLTPPPTLGDAATSGDFGATTESGVASSGGGFGARTASGVAVTASGAAVARAMTNSAAILEVGSLLGGRFEILEILGVGGMGAVYKAHDRDIDRIIALKCIRPDLADHPEIIQRFKQELLLARQVAHKNIIRIFDVRESGGLKFITMEHVAGRDLRGMLLERGKLAAKEAIDIMQQVCSGLAAAHAEGVLHRDLKPSNIMLDQQGRVVVMDFGLARSLSEEGMTRTGAMLGTLEYMSPEQARAQTLDARSDLYTVGLIFYELLTGKMPYEAASPTASILLRTHERCVPPAQLEPEIPANLSAVVCKCLEPEPKDRYENMQELIAELDAIQGKRPSSAFPETAVLKAAKPWPWIAITAAALAITIAIGSIWFVRSRASAPSSHKTVSVLLADFNNKTSDPVFDGALESGFSLALEGAPFITAYNRGQAKKTVGQLKPGASTLDLESAELVAVREGIGVVISGSVAKEGEGYAIDATALDPVSGKEIGSAHAEANSKDAVLQAVGSLAGRMRRVLGDTSFDASKHSQSETFTSASLEAVHDYSIAEEQRYAGKSDQAIQSFLAAIQVDPNFGSAYAGLAAMYANQGHREDATKYYQLAMQHIDRMTDREKYRTRGGYYLASMDPQKAIDEFSSLVQQYPADSMGHSALAFAYYLRHDMAKAIEEGRRALETYPKNVPYRNNVALYSIYAGDFATAEQDARKAAELNPAYVKAYVSVALAQIGQGHPDQATETYQKLEGVSALGASFAANGLADLALYQSRGTAAATILQKAIADDLEAKNQVAAAKKYIELAESQLMIGERAQALASLEKGVSLSKEDVLFAAGRLYAESGEEKKAAGLEAELNSKLEPLPQAEAKLIEGEFQLQRGKAKEAIKLFEDSKTISDTWLGHFELARAYLAAEAFAQADSELSECLKRRGEAVDVFSDEVETFHFFPAVYFYQGRVYEGLKSGAAADAYRTFIGLKAKDAQDPMVNEAKQRLAAR
jgi:serine/threonine protein kinase/tetratricopeptide (TPR) repeat protein